MLIDIYLETEHKEWMTAVACEGYGENRKNKLLAKTENKPERLILKMRVSKSGQSVVSSVPGSS